MAAPMALNCASSETAVPSQQPAQQALSAQLTTKAESRWSVV
jgi:hypothetical protein